MNTLMHQEFFDFLLILTECGWYSTRLLIISSRSKEIRTTFVFTKLLITDNLRLYH